jgi:hypothetical protein
MSLQITLDGQSEAIVRSQLAQGHARSPEELIERALTAYSGTRIKGYSLGISRKTPAEAVTDIRELRAGVTLGGLKVKELTHKGHKY